MLATAIKKLDQIIDSRLLQIYFHPIIFIKKQRIVAVEALCRAKDPETGKIILPQELFQMARTDGMMLPFLEFTIKRTIEAFQSISQKDKDLMLAINYDANLTGDEFKHLKRFLESISSTVRDHSNVVIELSGSFMDMEGQLTTISSGVSDYKFVLALDKVNFNLFNLERLLSLKPTVIKIDRDLIKDIDKTVFKKEFLRFITTLAHNQGIIVVAVGIERLEEALTCLKIGVDWFQGFYFAKDLTPQMFSTLRITEKYDELVDTYSTELERMTKKGKEKFELYNTITDSIVEKLSQENEEQFDYRVSSIIKTMNHIECIYILDERGIQVSNTIFQQGETKSYESTLFKPDKRGADQSLKDYYILIKTIGIERLITDSYISLASGNACITVCASFRNLKGNTYILCLDFLDNL